MKLAMRIALTLTLVLCLCLPLLADDISIPLTDLKSGDCVRIGTTGAAVKIPCPEGKVTADLAYTQARLTALEAQMRYELASCWNIETMALRFEAAQQAKKAEALKPSPPPSPSPPPTPPLPEKEKGKGDGK